MILISCIVSIKTNNFKRILLLILCLFSDVLFAQTNYTPIIFEKKNNDNIIQGLENRYKTDLKNLPKENKKTYKLLYQERFEELKSVIENNHIVIDSRINSYFENILKEIYRGNPTIDKEEIRFNITRYSSKNAVSYGEGTILFHLGLVRYFENESQIAFVICHEIAHYMLKHSNKKIKQIIDTKNDKNIQKEIRKIIKNDENQRQKAIELLKKIRYSSGKHSRFYEKEADEKAFEYLSNTNYSLEEGHKALAILGEVDKEKYSHLYPIDLKSVFHFEQYPFKDEWLKSNFTKTLKGQKNTEDAFDKDSLKTHPDCSERIKYYNKLLLTKTSKTINNPNIQSEKTLEEIKKIADYEVIQSDIFFDDYGEAMEKILLLLKQNPNDTHLKKQLAKCLALIYIAQKNHRLGDCIAYPNAKQSENYRKILEFIYNLRLSELGNITYYFFEKTFDTEDSDEYQWYYYIYIAKKLEKSNFKDLEEKYLKKFPEGKLKAEIEKI